jgi:cytochrome c-type biogenesis protein
LSEPQVSSATKASTTKASTAKTAHWPARTWVAAAVSAAVLAVAIGIGLRTAPGSWGPVIFVESLSAEISGVLLSVGARAHLWYAFVAGLVASVNPCGFVLLPAYLGYYLGGDQIGGDQSTGGGRRRVIRAMTIGATVAASFALLFGIAGIVADQAASAMTSALPWIGTTIGAGLILLGGFVASGRQLTVSLPARAANLLRPATRVRGLGGYAAYGTAYALASLGCTLPLFLAVVGTSLQLHGPAAAVGQFLLFGLGMGVVLAALTLATAVFGDSLVRLVRPLGRHVGWLSAALLWLAGAYVVYYWLTAIRLL